MKQLVRLTCLMGFIQAGKDLSEPPPPKADYPRVINFKQKQNPTPRARRGKLGTTPRGSVVR